MSPVQAKLLSVGCLSTLIAAMAAIDESFRVFLSDLARFDPSSSLSFSTVNIHHLSRSVIDVLPIQITAQGPLVVFLVIGGALGLFMFRT